MEEGWIDELHRGSLRGSGLPLKGAIVVGELRSGGGGIKGLLLLVLLLVLLRLRLRLLLGIPGLGVLDLLILRVPVRIRTRREGRMGWLIMVLLLGILGVVLRMLMLLALSIVDRPRGHRASIGHCICDTERWCRPLCTELQRRRQHEIDEK